MQRKTTILLVGAVVAILALGLIAPAVSADGTDDTQTTEDGEVQNATEVQAQYMAEWMETRMGPDGVESFEEQTGTTVHEVAYALVDNMRPVNTTWSASPGSPQYGPGTGYGYQAPGEGYGPVMPHGGYGPMMPHGGYGPMMPHGGYGPMVPGGNGYAPGPWGADNPGTGFGPNNGTGSSGYWNGGSDSGGFGSGGFGSGGYGPGMGGPGMGGGMGGGW